MELYATLLFSFFAVQFNIILATLARFSRWSLQELSSQIVVRIICYTIEASFISLS
jgi:hypothetical protein